MDKYKIVVSEPWDFVGENGTNVIYGHIFEIVSSQALLFQLDHLITYGSYKSDILLLKPRYEKQVFDDKEKLEGTVSGALVPSKNATANKDESFETNCKFILIGALKKC